MDVNVELARPSADLAGPKGLLFRGDDQAVSFSATVPEGVQSDAKSESSELRCDLCRFVSGFDVQKRSVEAIEECIPAARAARRDTRKAILAILAGFFEHLRSMPAVSSEVSSPTAPHRWLPEVAGSRAGQRSRPATVTAPAHTHTRYDEPSRRVTST